MRHHLAVLAAVLLVAGAGRVEAAPVHATPLSGGDRVRGLVDSGEDRDLFRIEIPRGAFLQASVKAARKSALLPALALLDPSGTPVDIGEAVVGLATKSVSIPSLEIGETGPWILSVSGHGGTTGAYRLTARFAAPSRVRATVVVPPGGTVVHAFTAVTGARVGYAVVERTGAGVGMVLLRAPDGAPVAGSGAIRSGRRLARKGIVLAGGGGLYGIEITNDSPAPTTVDVSAAIRFPRTKRRRFSLGEEPRPASVSPGGGRDGTPVVVRGTGFAPGARIVFGDADEAVDVRWISAVEVRGAAPPCASARRGDSVPVSVLNPDGQYGTAPDRFGFIGLPILSAISPTLSPLEGGILVTISGAGFREGFSVEVLGVPSPSVELLGPGTLTFLTPPAPAGVHDVVVLDEFGRAAVPIPGLWYSDPPVVDSAAPSTLASSGGVPVVLSGDGLVPGVRVLVAGTEAPVLASTPPSSVTILCPPARAGPVEVEVRDPLGRSFRGDILTMTRALHDATAAVIPPGPSGTDFLGHRVTLGDTTGDGLPGILVTATAGRRHPSTGLPVPASYLLANDGRGVFFDASAGCLPPFPLPRDDGQADAPVLGDLDGDGAAEAVLFRGVPKGTGYNFGMYEGCRAYYLYPGSGSLDMPTGTSALFLANDGTGVLSDRTGERAPARESTPADGAGERWQAVAAFLGDLDGDGDSDLLAVSSNPVDRGTVSGASWNYRYVYYGAPYYATRKIRDTVVLSQSVSAGSAFRVLRNDGAGAFLHDAAADPSPVLGSSGAVLDDLHGSACAVGDLDGDGLPDAVIVSAGPVKADDGAGGVKDAPALRVLLNAGSGTFVLSPSSVPAAPGASKPQSGEWWQGTSVALGDFDGDGDLDVVVGRPEAGTWSDGGEVRLFPALVAFRNDGRGVLSEDGAGLLPPDVADAPTGRTIIGVSSLAAADLDGDGDDDLALTSRYGAPFVPDIPGGSRPCTRVFLSRGPEGMEDATEPWLGAAALPPSDGLAIGDLDGDGFPDLVLVVNFDLTPGVRTLRAFLNR